MTPDAQTREMTDGFQLVIEALKLNGIDTIFGLPGIPVTDLIRRSQAAGTGLPGASSPPATNPAMRSGSRRSSRDGQRRGA